MKGKKLLILILFFMFISTSLSAESTEFELFYPNIVPEGTLMVQSYKLQEPVWSMGLIVQIEKSPVVFTDQDGNFINDKVFYRAQAHFVGSYKFFDKFSVGFDFPGTFLSDQLSDTGNVVPHLSYLNDMVISGRYSIWHNDKIGIGVTPFFFLSTGSANNLGGTDYRFAEPGFIIMGEYFKDDFFTRINLGYSERDYTSISKYSLQLDDKLIYSVGVGGKWYKNINMSVELNGSSQFDSMFSNIQTNALEIMFGAQKKTNLLVFNKGGLIFSGGLGFGITKAYGVPAWRLIFGVYSVPVLIKVVKKPKPLPKPGTLELTVLGKENKSISLAKVLFIKDKKKIVKMTDKLGKVEYSSLRGIVNIKITKHGYYPYLVSQTIQSGKIISKNILLKPVLPTKGKLLLILVGEDNKPIEGVTVLFDNNGNIFKKTSNKFGMVSYIAGKSQLKISLKKDSYIDKNVESRIKVGKVIKLKVLLKQIPKNPIINAKIVNSKTNEPVKTGEVFIPELKVKYIFENGKFTHDFSPGDYNIVFSAKEYFPYKVTATLKSNEVRELNVRLIKKNKEQKVIVTENEILIIDKIYFKTASYKILKKSNSILDSIVSVLKEHKEIKKIIIKGYTDSRGSKRYNEKLSRNRAREVMRYFVKKGINKNRLEYKGFGPLNPIADNKTKDGRAKNRRVEFEIKR